MKCINSLITPRYIVKSEMWNLNNLMKWTYPWLLAFHPDKCKVLSLGNRTEDAYGYKWEKRSLEHTDHEKDLGVINDKKLKFLEHINEKVNKSNSIMGVIRRSFRFLDCKFDRNFTNF